MLFYWLKKFFTRVGWLFVLPNEQRLAKLNPRLKCPVCGCEDGRLRCVEELVQEGANKPQTVIYCQHTCGECGARFFEKPIAKVTPAHVRFAVPRDKLESEEDKILQRHLVMPPADRRLA